MSEVSSLLLTFLREAWVALAAAFIAFALLAGIAQMLRVRSASVLGANLWVWESISALISILVLGLFAFLGIPQIVLTGVIFPRWIMPFPQVAGWFDWIKQFFQAVWMAFDVGTSIALAKYFAQYRVKQPQKAVHYIQIFVWWQLLSGVVQIVSLSVIGSVVFPDPRSPTCQDGDHGAPRPAVRRPPCGVTLKSALWQRELRPRRENSASAPLG